MPGIAIGNCIPFNRGGVDWSSYWATLISATVENAAPTHVVLTFPVAQTSLTDADFTITGFTIASGSWTGAVLTLVLSTPVLIFHENLTITFVKTGDTGTVTNNVADDGHTVAWYDSKDLTTITKDGSDFVSKWADKLGSGHDLLQATGTNQPKWVLNYGVLFDGHDNYLKTLTFVWNQPEMVYAVIKNITWVAGKFMFDGLNVTNQINCSFNGVTPQFVTFAGTLDANLRNGDLPLDTFGIVRALYNGANSTNQVNNNAAKSGSLGSQNASGFTIGSNVLPASYGNIQVKEVICRKSADNAATQKSIYNYLATKHGFATI